MGTSTRESCHNCKQMIWHAKAQLQQLIWASIIIIIVDLISTPPIHQSIQPAFWLASYALPSTAYTLHSVKKYENIFSSVFVIVTFSYMTYSCISRCWGEVETQTFLSKSDHELLLLVLVASFSPESCSFLFMYIQIHKYIDRTIWAAVE